jgi:hypothetical protein
MLSSINNPRSGNRTGRVGFGFESGGSGQFDLLEKIGSGRVGSGSGRIGSIYMLCFFILLIDFDWIEGHLISGRVGFGSDQVSLTFLKNRISLDSDPDGSDGFLRSDRILPPLNNPHTEKNYINKKALPTKQGRRERVPGVPRPPP